MEYEKHINKLVLGYLKTKCKSSYKTFLRTNFPSPTKHIGTRVAGQTLEDILRIYSQVQEIVQARLEYTDYYKEHDGASPMYLAEQLLYLLDRRPLETPATSIRDRSPCESSLADYNNEEHFSDVETTPEHTLPGNTPTNDANSQTPFRSQSHEFKTPYSEKIPPSNHEFITSVMSQTLLNKSSFPGKLADNINAVLNTPKFPAGGNAEKKGVGAELENTIQQALNRTERDSIFEGLLEDLWEPLTNSFGKAITAEAAAITTSINSKKQEKYTNVEEHNNGAISSILAVSNTDQLTNHDASSPTGTPQVTSTQQTYQVTPTSQVSPTSQVTPNSQVINQPQMVQNYQVNNQPQMVQNPQVNNQPQMVQTPQVNNQPQMVQTVQPNIPYQGPIYAIPAEQQQQQYFILNRPLVIPPQMQMMQIIQAPGQRKGKSRGKINNLSEGEIMAMPTIILNEKNEMAYADPNTPYKSREVNNIQDYLNHFGATSHSPIIKSTPTLKPTPTVKVEIYHRDEPFPTDKNAPSKDLPNLANTTTEDDDVIIVATDPPSTEKSTANETKVKPVNLKGLNSTCTPSPLDAVAKKPTPKSSSHVRNLTFPSPLKKTGEKDDGGRNLPSAISKQQATKDLFKTTPEETEKPKTTTPKRLKATPKKATKTKKTIPKKPLEKTSSHSWDSALRKNLASLAEEANESTPLRRMSTRKRATRSTELDTTEADGKIIEDALKTPVKGAEKSKGKTPKKRTRAENKNKTNEEKLPQVEEVPKVEASIEPKTILSPSNLCNTASKRNMEFDGITPSNSKEGSTQLVSNARKNISAMLETPLKDDENEINIPPTPLTQMLQANLKDYTNNGDFSIHTPNLPITPGLTFNMETSSAPYYTLNDTETNKATEAIVLLEERKSSVRKTDDEDVVVSPKIYSKGILKEFNKRCVGQKNLDLLSQENVQWEGNSDRGDHSDESLSDETNNTIIPNNRKRSSGKSMSILKSNFLDETNKSEVCEENIKDKLLETKVKAKGVSSSSDSEIISKAEHANKEKLDDVVEEDIKNVDTTKKCEQSCANVSISTITSETIKEAVSATTTLTSHMTTAYSIKKEMDEKRKRMINLEKGGTKAQGGRRKNAKPNSKAASSKRKKNTPKKSQKDVDDSEENDNDKTDSQDEFFKKSGTNLHRTRNQMEELGESERKNRQSSESQIKLASNEAPKASTSNSENPALDESIYGHRVMETLSKEIHIKYDPKTSNKKPLEDYSLDLMKIGFKFFVPLQDAPDQVIHTTVTPFIFVLEIEPGESGSDLESVEETRSKKRKRRASSTNSNTSGKKLKGSLMPNSLGTIAGSLGTKDAIEKVLAQLHGPSDKI